MTSSLSLNALQRGLATARASDDAEPDGRSMIDGVGRNWHVNRLPFHIETTDL
jgi:hypothetical protein